jgi:hypothetical protein
LLNFPTSQNFTDFSNYIFIQNSEEKLEEILPASSTKKYPPEKLSDFQEPS